MNQDIGGDTWAGDLWHAALSKVETFRYIVKVGSNTRKNISPLLPGADETSEIQISNNSSQENLSAEPSSEEGGLNQIPPAAPGGCQRSTHIEKMTKGNYINVLTKAMNKKKERLK